MCWQVGDFGLGDAASNEEEPRREAVEPHLRLRGQAAGQTAAGAALAPSVEHNRERVWADAGKERPAHATPVNSSLMKGDDLVSSSGRSCEGVWADAAQEQAHAVPFICHPFTQSTNNLGPSVGALTVICGDTQLRR